MSDFFRASGGPYRPDIDGLRAVAVLAVIGFHYFPDYFPGGFVGVDVFFVISGFLITSVILRQLQGSTFTLVDFYSRRVRRIFPALVILLAASLVFGIIALLPDELEELGKHLTAAATFASNFELWRESGYFDRAAELKPLLHLWSLGIEEQFYLFWPLLLLLLWKRRHNIAVTVALLTLASFGLTIAVGSQKRIASFYFPFSRFWELGLGCLVAIVMESPPSIREAYLRRTQWLRRSALHPPLVSLATRAQTVLPVVGIVLIVGAVFVLDRHTTHPGWATLAPTLGAMFLICTSGDSWFQRRVLAASAMVFLGTISYSLYLWHWPLLSFANIIEAETPALTIRVAAILLSVALAWLSFRFVEHPIRARRSMRVAVALIGALAVLGIAGFAVYASSGLDQRFEREVHAIRPEPRTNLRCLHTFRGNHDFNYCKSTSAASPEVIFLGDSRAQALYDGTAELMGQDYSMTLLARGGCPPLLDVPYRDSNGCNDAWNGFLKYIAQVRPRAVVLVGGGAWVLDESALQLEDSPFRNPEEAFGYGLRQLVERLQRTSTVFYVREFPSYESAPSCFLRRIRLPGSHCVPNVGRDAMEQRLASYNRIVDGVQRGLPELRVVDSIPALCSPVVCSQKLSSGEIIYSDQLHLSPAGGRYFALTSGLLASLASELQRGSGPESSE